MAYPAGNVTLRLEKRKCENKKYDSECISSNVLV